MIIYNVIRSNITPTAAQDFFTIISNATRSFGILEVDVEGAFNTSNYTETAFYRVTTVGATGGGAILSQALNPANPASGFSVMSTWVTQPTLAAAPFHNCPANSNGQRYFWRAMPNLSNALWSPGGGSTVAAGIVSLRPITINNAITARAQVGEI